jgi:hypothetical protein
VSIKDPLPTSARGPEGAANGAGAERAASALVGTGPGL